MKKKLLLITLLLILPIKVYAFTGSVSIACNKTDVKAGDTISCAINGTTDTAITSYAMSFTISGEVSATGFTSGTGWSEDALSNNTIMAFSTGDEVTGNITFGTLTLKVSDTASTGTSNLSFHDISFYADADDSEYTVDDTNVSLTITGAKGLKQLEVPGATLGGSGFSNTTYTYAVVLDSTVTTFGINATPMKSGDTITYKNEDGTTISSPSNITFAPATGKTTMEIVISVGADADLVEYTLIVSRQSSGSTAGAPTLSSLKVGGRSVDLATEDITVTLNDTSSYTVEATLTDKTNYEFDTSILPGSSCSVNDGKLTCNLSGNNSIVLSINSKAAGGESKIYRLSVTSGSSGGSSGSNDSNSNSNPTYNPETGNTIQTIVAIILVVSFITTYYFFKQNIKKYDN